MPTENQYFQSLHVLLSLVKCEIGERTEYPHNINIMIEISGLD